MKCSFCLIDKPCTDFYYSTYYNRQWTKCKSCHCLKAYQRNIVERKKQKQEYIFRYLQKHPCIDCGEIDIVVLQFDHVRGEKKYTMAHLDLMSIETIDKEIAKCDVVCANCHTKRTAKRGNWYKLLWLENNYA